MADGCSRVYVDMGTNVGTQIRKLFEPELFTNFTEGNPSEAIFSRTFGAQRGDVCAFGFEASPRHTPRLHRLGEAYRAAGWRVTIFTETAVNSYDGKVSFFYDSRQGDSIDGGASIFNGTGGATAEVRSLDMAEWMNNEVHGRRIPPDPAYPPAILMKTDIERNDMRVLSHMLVKGALCGVTRIYGEHMEEPWLSHVREILKLGNCSLDITLEDDETGQGGMAFIDYPLPGRKEGGGGGGGGAAAAADGATRRARRRASSSRKRRRG